MHSNTFDITITKLKANTANSENKVNELKSKIVREQNRL